MKLLFVTPHLPYPPRSGSTIIAYHYMRTLGARHAIDLVSFGESETADYGQLREACRNIWLTPHVKFRSSRLARLISKSLGVPTQVSLYLSGRMKQLVRQALAQNDYDAVIFLMTEMSQYCPSHYAGALVLFMEDPLVLKFQRSLERYSSHGMRLRAKFEAALLKRYEIAQTRRFDRVLLINANDVEDYKQILPNRQFDWIPHGIDINLFQPSNPQTRQDGTVIITGNMFHRPNIEAVEFFCRRILPLVRQEVPSARLWLVGANPGPEVQKWARDEQITVTGAVPDMQTYLQRALVSVCAVSLKIGTQTKILEAMACGTPVVTTSAGNHGINATSGTHLYVADEPEIFARYVVSLLKRERWSELSQNGRKFVVDNFAWEIGATKLEKIIEGVLHKR